MLNNIITKIITEFGEVTLFDATYQLLNDWRIVLGIDTVIVLDSKNG